MKYCEANDYYLDLICMGKAYAHFFRKTVAEKVYSQIRTLPSQFQDCELKLLQKKEEEDYFKKIYSYLRDPSYYDYVYELRDEKARTFISSNVDTAEKKEESKETPKEEKKTIEYREFKTPVVEKQQSVDEDGFMKVKNKKIKK
jgi:hypothetical protein